MSAVDQILDTLRQKALSMPPGRKLPSVRSMMNRYNVSLYAVNIALRKLETEGLLDVRKGSGIYISPQKNTRYIELHRPSYPSRILDIKELSLRRALDKAGYKLLLRHHSDEYEDPDILPNTKACAYIVMSSLLDTRPSFYSQLISQHVPVLVYGRAAGPYHLDYVTGDDYQYLSLLVKHLLNLGHRRLGMLNNEPLSPHIVQRSDIFHNITNLFDLPQPTIIDCKTHFGESSMLKAYEGLSTYLRKTNNTPAFTALITASPSGVISSLRAFYEAGLTVPQNCSLCSFGIEPENALSTPSVTEVGVDDCQWGQGAVKALNQRFDNPESPVIGIKLSPKLHVRETSAEPSQHC